MMSTHLSRRSLLWALMAALPTAQAFPLRPIRIVCPFPPGGGSDFVARLLAAKLQDLLGSPVVVENRSGAAGMLGIESVVRAQPDGHTLVYLSSAVTIQPALVKVPYNIERDLVPISQVIRVPYVLSTRAGGRFARFEDAVQEARSGRAVTYATYGVGSPTHLLMEQVQSALKVEFTHVPYRGGVAIMPDLMAGRVDLAWDLPVSTVPHISAGKLAPLLTSGPQRAAMLPQVRALPEVVPQLDVIGWSALMAPAGTPESVAQKLQPLVRAALFSADVEPRLREQGYEPIASTPAELRRVIATELATWGALVRDKGIKAE
jgi:tripartite-type tricarboxylate transporter receptor subunit TctC